MRLIYQPNSSEREEQWSQEYILFYVQQSFMHSLTKLQLLQLG